MNRKHSRIIHLTLGFVFGLIPMGQSLAGDKPLKIYILAGQSNMQGQAQVKTIERLQYAGGSKEMYQDMTGGDGIPDAPKGVYGVYFTDGDMKSGSPRPLFVNHGPMLPGFAENPGREVRFGPDYTFGIYMQKHLNEPILLIKTAWGGRDLIQQFRPPGAGPFEQEKDGHGNPTGAYYKLMVEHVKSVLADPAGYHPQYDPKQGYEIAGFVWFQGFNDYIRDYPDEKYSEYTRLLAALIHDLRKDLNAPRMPCVIGVMGIGGIIEDPGDKQYRFREAQAAVADLPDFKGNVAAVRTAPLWDIELQRIEQKLNTVLIARIKEEDPNIKVRSLSKRLKEEAKAKAPGILTPEELKIRNTGTSNQAFHYMGSALIYGNIGKAFANAMAELSGKR